jgi:hypothetical protein
LRHFYGRIHSIPSEDERWILLIQMLIDRNEEGIINWIMRKVRNYIPLYSLEVTVETYHYFLRYPGLVKLRQ